MTAENSLETALALAERAGWAPIPLMPLRKDAALSGYYQSASQDPTAIRDQWRRAQFRIAHDEQHPERADLEPGIGVVLGRSGLAVLDADTPEQVSALAAAFTAHGLALGDPTVRTPGAIDPDGTVRHKDGGHWYRRLPADIAEHGDLLSTSKIVLKIGTGEHRADLMTGRCYVATVPTRRPEGRYVQVAAGPIPMLETCFATDLRAEVARLLAARERAECLAADGVRDEAEWSWFDRTPWSEVLPDDYREVGRDPDGCVAYLREGGSSQRSATVHVAGCSHVTGGDPTRPPLCTFFTSEKPDYVIAALTRRDGTPKQSAGKFSLWVHKHHHGDFRAARAAAGLPESRRRVPTALRARRQATTADWRSTVTWTVHKLAPLPPRPVDPPRPEPVVEEEPDVWATPVAEEAPSPWGAPAPLAEVTDNAAVTSAPAPVSEADETATADDTDFAPEVLPGLPADAPLPAAFTPRNLVAEIVTAALRHAEWLSPDMEDSICEVEGDADRFAGRDDDPDSWTNRHRSIRDRRTWLMGLNHVSTGQLAAEVGGIDPSRVRSVMRLLLPMFDTTDLLVRERPPYDAFRYWGKKEKVAADEDGTEQERRPEDYTAAETCWAIWDPTDREAQLPAFPSAVGACAIDPDDLPRDVPVLSRRADTDPIVFVPPAGTDPRSAIAAVMASVPNGGIIAVDVETTGTAWGDTVRTIQLGSGVAAVVLDASDGRHLEAVSTALIEHVISGRIWATAHNSSFDCLHLHRMGVADGIALLNNCLDTYVLQSLIEAPLNDKDKKGGSGDRRGLKALTNEWLPESWSSRAEDAMHAHWAAQGWRGQNGWTQTPVDDPVYLYYGGHDTIDASRLCATLLGVLHAGLGPDVAHRVIVREHIMARVAGMIQLNGFRVDLDVLARDEAERQEQAEKQRQVLLDMGLENPNSTLQIKATLIAERQSVIDRRAAEARAAAAAAGQNTDEAESAARSEAEDAIPEITSTGKEVLRVASWSRLAPEILAYRSIAKTSGTYTASWPRQVDEEGRLHPTLNTLKASTGRFSCASPNLQNVPAGLRHYIIAAPGHSILSADFSAIEMRVGAALADEDRMIDELRAGEDPYTLVARIVHNTPTPTKDQRNSVKPVELGRMYGRSAGSVAHEQQGRDPDADFDELLSWAEYVMKTGIDQPYPRLKAASYELGGKVRCGQTRITFDSGRSISIDPSSARKSFNAAVQGAAREILVDAGMALINAGLGKYMWFTIHDEWLLHVPEAEAEEVAKQMAEVMTAEFHGVPIVVESKVLGPHWKKA